MITQIIIIAAIVIVAIYSIRTITILVNRSINAKVDRMISSTEYTEEKIVAHLDYIINEALDQYFILNIMPKNISYIKNSTEDEIVKYLQETIPNRISKTLMTQLSIIYNNEYLGEFIGMHIYLTVVDYVLVYNNDHANVPKK